MNYPRLALKTIPNLPLGKEQIIEAADKFNESVGKSTKARLEIAKWLDQNL